MGNRDDDSDMGKPEDRIKKILFSAGFGAEEKMVAAQPAASTFLMCVAADYRCDAPGVFDRTLSDASDFDDLISRAAPELTIRVEDKLAGGDLDITLQFEELADFNPASFAQKVSSIASALSAHILLHTRAKGGIDTEHLHDGLAELDLPPALQARLTEMTEGGGAAAAPSKNVLPKDQGGSDLDKLLSMVDAPDTGPSAPGPDASTEDTARAGLNAFISEIVTGSGGQDHKARQAARYLDQLIAEQIDAILTHEDFAALEAAWRGLAFLVKQSDFRAGVRLLPRQIDWDSASDETDDVLEGLFASPADGEARPDVVVLAAPIHNTDISVSRLGKLAAEGEAYQTPVLCSLAEEFTGLDAATLPAMNDPGLKLSGPAFESWNALRDRSAARWLVAAWNDPLARHPWEPAEDKRLKLVGAGKMRDAGLRVPAAFAVAAMMAQSQKHLGWPSEIVGKDGRLEGLEMEEMVVEHSEKISIPFAFPVTSDVAHSLADVGILALACRYNRDTATLVAAPTVHKPGTFPDDPGGVAARRLSSLPYQIVVSRIVRALHDLPMGQQSSAEQTVRAALEPILASSGPGASLDVKMIPDPDEPGAQMLEVEARTGNIVGGGLTVFLDLPL